MGKKNKNKQGNFNLPDEERKSDVVNVNVCVVLPLVALTTDFPVSK